MSLGLVDFIQNMLQHHPGHKEHIKYMIIIVCFIFLCLFSCKKTVTQLGKHDTVQSLKALPHPKCHITDQSSNPFSKYNYVVLECYCH